jgi:hypothetical protein
MKKEKNPRLQSGGPKATVLKGKATPLRWMMINVHMVAAPEIERGMEIATIFEERHGGKPPMYFARYTDDMTIRITVLTPQTDKELKKHFRRLGIHKLRIVVRGGGSWQHCHMFQVAKHVFGKTPNEVQDVVHWLHNMCNYNYLQEITNYLATSANFACAIIRRPGEPVPTAAKPG